ncbi:hypothetical protein LK09_00880 [Microbacterium mangrovi]|uniref:Uncharacterized protein n=1 Tax=Microbacterium mangrovi TaxID=1348253 RepID=A0A0B2AE56_9MICO|nr:hypothetical protein LK09_00880 [Microbacterium mangrovi]
MVLAGIGGAGAYAAPPSPPPTGYVAQATPTVTATLVGTTRLDFGGMAGGGSAVSGSTKLPATIPASRMPHTPDVGDKASATTAKHASVSRVGMKANPINPTVAGQPVAGATANLSASVAGLNAFDQGITHPVYDSSGHPLSLPGVDIEPPDQGVCAGNGYVMEINNVVARVFSANLTGGTKAAPIESLFKTPEVFGAAGDGSFSIQGDPRCFYDAQSGRWFASQLWLDENDATGYGWAGTFVAVSTSGDPNGTWNDYFVPDAYNATGTSTCNNLPPTDPSANPCLGDQPLLGVDGASVQISTNEYSVFRSNPAAQAGLYFLSKAAMVAGAKSVSTLFSAVGATVAAPGAGPWYSLTPAQAPDGRYSTANGGTSYALSALDFVNAGDNRIAEWAYTNTSAVDHGGSVKIFETTLSSGQYAAPPLPTVAQKTGSVPLALVWNRLNGAKKNSPLPEGGIATNDDRMGSVTVDPSTGALLGALNTGVNQPRTGSTALVQGGIAYFVTTPVWGATGLVPGSVTTGYIAPAGANAVYPGVAVAASGAGVIGYTLTGSAYYPSQAYTVIRSGDQVGSVVHVARSGVGPQDGFSEYQDIGTGLYSPRWGDYGAAVAHGSTITFAGEMIGQSCTSTQFASDFTCGGTRDLFANWGTGVSTLSVP